jgi:sugar phosphate isomerase/epimerase
MRIGLLGLIASDLTDVDAAMLDWARRIGFGGLAAHSTVPADDVANDIADDVRTAIADSDLHLLQAWGPYPCIISADEDTRRAGVEGARGVVRLAHRLGVACAGVRPTSLNPRGDWWPHPANHTTESEERFVRSLAEIVETAADLDVCVVLEVHGTTTLDSPSRVRRVIERVAPERIRVNIDPVNFINDLPTAFDHTAMLDELFGELGRYCDTVHVKDVQLDDRLVVHISEAVPGTGILDLGGVLTRTEALGPDTFAMVEHLPMDQVKLAHDNIRAKADELSIEVRS